ncbi:MAG: alpha/beta hydrolase [Oscillospiraceae bacterium]|nr:alpha/beta hydrolase [Oscillospiraceae bacterium]
MIHKNIELYDGKPHIHMTAYIAEKSKEMRNNKRGAVLVLPGGGYGFTSDREAEPVAKMFFAAGYNTFVLRYSTGGDAFMYNSLLDACLAMKIIRDNADEWNIDKDKITVCGFSAGGHLAASLGTLWKLGIIRETLGCENEYIRPDGMILCYPVITAGEKANKGSFRNLLKNENPAEAELNLFSLEKQVDADTCPAFIWHTADDQSVPVENSLYFCEALSKFKVPFELHIFPRGPHGLSTATAEVANRPEEDIPYVARWVEMALLWLVNSGQ